MKRCGVDERQNSTSASSYFRKTTFEQKVLNAPGEKLTWGPSNKSELTISAKEFNYTHYNKAEHIYVDDHYYLVH